MKTKRYLSLAIILVFGIFSDISFGNGGTLDFRILPNNAGSSLYPISPFEISEYIEKLKHYDSNIDNSSEDEYVWLPLTIKVGKEQDDLVKYEYNNQIYVLASNKIKEIILDDGSWDIIGVNLEREENEGNYHSITARFDEYGQHLFSSLTDRWKGRVLAIIRDGKVVYTAKIKRRMWRATIEGDFTWKQTVPVSWIFEQVKKPWQSRPPYLGNLDRQVMEDYIKATNGLRKGKDRAELAQVFSGIGTTYPETIHCQRAAELGKLLKVMAEEDKNFVEPQDVNSLSQSEKIEYYVYKLRDLSESEFFIPGRIRFLQYSMHKKTPATALRKMGKNAVPALIKLLEDRRPTRSVTGLMNGGAITRNCDVALEIIESISGKTFDFHRGRGYYLSTAGPKLRDRIIQDVKEWWSENKPDAQIEN